MEHKTGNPELALAEECAEVIQVITKKHRFNGNWDEIPPGKDKTRAQMLDEEMSDLIYWYNEVLKERGVEGAYTYTSFEEDYKMEDFLYPVT